MKYTIKIYRMPASCVFVFISMILTLVFLLTGSFFPPIFSKIIKALLPIFILIALSSFLFFEKQYLNLSKDSKKYFWGLIIISIYMFLSYMINSSKNVEVNSSILIVDIISMLLFISGVIFAPPSRHKYIKGIYVFFGIFGVIGGTIGIFLGDFSATSVALRDLNTWSPAYYLWFSLFPWSALIIYSLLSSKKTNTFRFVFLAYSNAILYFTLGVLFFKRVVLIEILLILFIFIIKNRGMYNFFRTIIFITAALGIIMAFMILFKIELTVFVSNTISRITNQSISSFDRLLEYKNATSSFTIYEYLFGKGYGSYHYGLGWAHGNLHIGWLNFIFKKGGIAFFLLQLTAFAKTSRLFVLSKKGSESSIYSSIAIFNFMIAAISTYWTITPTILMFSMFTFASLNASFKDKAIKFFGDTVAGEIKN